jgi:hypothetical protein
MERAAAGVESPFAGAAGLTCGCSAPISIPPAPLPMNER